MGRILKEGSKISEVAAAAGVSRATVSRVMNGNTKVAPDIAERVRAAADKLEYRPSTLARGLSLGRSSTVAVVLPDLSNPMFQQLLRGAMDAAHEHGYRILIAETAGRSEDERDIITEARARCDGLILVAPRLPSTELDPLLARQSPVVLVNRDTSVPEIPSLMIDHAAGMSTLVEHLASLGHRHLVYVAGPDNSLTDPPRREGIARALATRPDLVCDVITGGTSIDAGFQVADAVLASGATGVLAFNDLVAFGLLARFNEAGVSVPADISVTGFDDIELARYSTPSLTTLSVLHARMGRQAWDLVLTGMSGGAVPPPQPWFQPALEIRSSTGDAPPAGSAAPTAGPSPAMAEPRWNEADGEITLEGPSGRLARVGADDIPPVHSRRPYLHPVRTLAGRLMTSRSPVDHRHHYGVSLAVPDVNGTSYWGGRTYTVDAGSQLLDNHGRQVVTSRQASKDALISRLDWISEAGRVQLHEERTLTAAICGQDAWSLRWSSVLSPAAGAVTLSSPGAKGRVGAGYGGLFWRLPVGGHAVVLSPAGDAAHGSTSSWAGLSIENDGEWASLLLIQHGTPLPWFVRAEDYIGIGPSLAWENPRTLAAGDALSVDVTALLVDGRLDSASAARRADAVTSADR